MRAAMKSFTCSDIKRHLVFLCEHNNQVFLKPSCGEKPSLSLISLHSFSPVWNSLSVKKTQKNTNNNKQNPCVTSLRYRAIHQQALRNPRRWGGRQWGSRCPVRRSWKACPVPLSTDPDKSGRRRTHPEWCCVKPGDNESVFTSFSNYVRIKYSVVDKNAG